MYSEAEREMWRAEVRESAAMSSDDDINRKYEMREQRIMTETAREKLPGFVESIGKPGYLELRPFYQRRARWDRKRQSRLIESFIMNIPVPPIFLYEKEYGRYELMDGQQRVTALREFYANRLRLGGLQHWPELNGRTYAQLPAKIRAGIDRRSISSVILLKESTSDEEEAMLLRHVVFERLNTGGVKLSRQEIRNALHQGPFNSVLIRLAERDDFCRVWGIPPAPADRETEVSKARATDSRFMKMRDVEVVLRFFALRHASEFRRGMQGFLDLYMHRSHSFTSEDVAYLERLFGETLELAIAIFGNRAFHPYVPNEQRWADKPRIAFWDAVMVSLSKRLDASESLVDRANQISEATKALFEAHPRGTFTGRGNTKKDVQNRIDLFGAMLDQVISGAGV